MSGSWAGGEQITSEMGIDQFLARYLSQHDMDKISYSDFIDRELFLFSMADNIHSIPSVGWPQARPEKGYLGVL